MQLSPSATLFHADCRDALRSLPSDSVDAVVTDPPYELNFMGKGWDNTGIANDPALWAEVFRVLKPGGHCAAFSASRTYHRMACAIEDAGFEIRDSLMWVYGTGFPKSQDVSKFIDKALGAEREKVAPRSVIGHQRNIGNVRPYMLDPDHQTDSDEPVTDEARAFQGFGTALKPAFEPIVLARKPLSEATVAANVLKWRTGALNIGASRVGTEGGTKGCDAGPSNGILGDGLNGSFGKPVPGLGRWPANVVHDGSDEVVGAFPSTGGGGTPRSASPNKGSAWAIGQERSSIPGGATYCDAGSAARFFYSAKASKQDRNGSKHPTVKPIALMEWLATLITPPGGTILDPFAGSGTTGIAATNKGFQVILCEREAEYVADIRARFGTPRRLPPFPLDALRAELALAPALASLRARLCAA
jgi:DNA modification methylase